jgi:hypothetical protein
MQKNIPIFQRIMTENSFIMASKKLAMIKTVTTYRDLYK